jgi:DNA primase
LIPPEQIEAIRQATDMVDLVSGYLKLRPAGRNFLALCPFHREKTPSFNVNPERQIYKCFGCQEAGDVFSFVMKVENLTFPEAARALAERAGITIKEDVNRRTVSDGSPEVDRERLADALAFATNLYRRVLHQEPQGAPGRDYLKGRGIAAGMAETWGLGYAPHEREYLLSRATRAGFTPAELERAGLCYPEADGRPAGDRLNRRVVFPIHDSRDRVVGFGGRAIGEDQKAKYINSPEGPLFQKSRLLYGLNRVNQARRANPTLKDAPIFVAEGYLDVMALHAAGVVTAVAPLGTALTADHVKRLRPFGVAIVLVFDGDRAGTEATRRAIAELIRQDVEVQVTRPTAGRDPFAIFQDDGPDALRTLVNDTVSAYDFLLERALDDHGESVEGRAAAAQALAAVLGQTPNPVKEDGYIRRAAFDLRTREPSLRRVWAAGKTRRFRSEAEPGAERTASEAGWTGSDRDVRADRDLGLALLGDPKLVLRAIREVPLRCIRDAQVRKIVGFLYDMCEENRDPETARVLDRLLAEEDPDGCRLAAELINEADERARLRSEGRTDRERDPFEDLYQGYVAHTRRIEAGRQRQELLDRMMDAMARSDDATVSDNLEAIAKLDRSRHKDASGVPNGGLTTNGND